LINYASQPHRNDHNKNCLSVDDRSQQTFLKKKGKDFNKRSPNLTEETYQTPFRLSTKPAYPPVTAMDPYNACANAEKVLSHTASQEQGNCTLPSPSNIYQSSENGSIGLLKIRNAHS